MSALLKWQSQLRFHDTFIRVLQDHSRYPILGRGESLLFVDYFQNRRSSLLP